MQPSLSDRFDHLTDFDEAGALARLGDDPELLAELIELFVGQRPALWARLEAAAAVHDAAAIERAAHAIKGALMTLAADRGVAIARALEHCGRHETLGEVPALCAALRDALERFEARCAAQAA